MTADRSVRPDNPAIRFAQREDYDQLGLVMFHAVKHSPSAYTREQQDAWVPEVRRGNEWSIRLSEQTILLAETEREVVGFMSLAASGYIDLAFIIAEFQGTGLFRRLYEQLEELARNRSQNRLWVHASIMAQPAFSAMGFSILEEQTVEVRGQKLRRFEMEKLL